MGATTGGLGAATAGLGAAAGGLGAGEEAGGFDETLMVEAGGFEPFAGF